MFQELADISQSLNRELSVVGTLVELPTTDPVPTDVSLCQNVFKVDPRTYAKKINELCPNASRILNAGQISASNDQTFDNLYFKKLSPQVQENLLGALGDVFRPDHSNNIYEHCTTVAALAYSIGSMMFGPDSEEVSILTHHAFTHDANKALEAMRKQFNRALTGLAKQQDEGSTALLDQVYRELKEQSILSEILNPYTNDSYMAIGRHLVDLGVDPNDVELLLASGAFTGHNSIEHFLVASNEGYKLRPRMLIEKIVHLADNWSSTPMFNAGVHEDTTISPAEERMCISDFRERYFDLLWKEGLSIEGGNSIVTGKLEELGGTHKIPYAYMQVALTDKIADELATYSGISTKFESPQKALLKVVERRMTAAE